MVEIIQGLDERVLVWIAEHLRFPVLDAIFSFYTQLGNGGMLFILVTLALLLFRSTRRAGLSALIAMLMGLVATNIVLKPLIARSRPWVVMEDFAALIAEADPHSFPSGHTCAAFAFGVALYVAMPQKWAKALALSAAILMGFSRLYVGVHFPSDVLVAAVVGTVCGLVGALAAQRIEKWFRQIRIQG